MTEMAMDEHDFEDDGFRPRDRLGDQIAEMRTGLLRATLLFGAVAMALALVLAPVAQGTVEYASRPQLDMMTTGSIVAPSNTYTVRRSVLQPAGAAPCVLFPGGKASDAGC